MDVGGAIALWAVACPHLPVPGADEAVVVMHMARTGAASLDLRHRAYSHAWLRDNDYPSQLPDEMRPRAERMYPKIADSVGISVNTSSDLFRPIVPLVERAMSDAVLECYADGHRESEVVRPRMFEARRDVVRKLLGR